MAITKNDEQVKINSGDNFKVYFNNAWTTLGHVVSGKLSKKGTPKEIKYASGYKFNKKSSQEGMFTVVLAQVSKELLDVIDQLSSAKRRLYIYNGLDDSKHMEFYIPAANLIEQIDLTMAGDEHQTIQLDFSIVPQTGNASVTPTTDMPSDRYATSASPVTGYNPFWVVLETTAS